MNDREHQLYAAAEIGRKYLAKAVADDLMSNCVISPETALRRVSDLLAAASEATPSEPDTPVVVVLPLWAAIESYQAMIEQYNALTEQFDAIDETPNARVEALDIATDLLAEAIPDGPRNDPSERHRIVAAHRSHT